MNELTTLNDAIKARLELVEVNDEYRGYSSGRVLMRDRQTDKFYLMSWADVPFSGQEILVFPADAKGEVTSWLDVAGGRGITWMEAAQSLFDYVNQPTCDLCGEVEPYPDDDWNDETGNHRSCEESKAENEAYDQAKDDALTAQSPVRRIAYTNVTLDDWVMADCE